MALQKCSECGHEVSTAAAACPQCGARIDIALAKKKNARSGRVWLIVLLVIGGLIAIPVLYHSSNEPPTAPTTAAPAVVDSAALKADYLRKVSIMSSGMHDMKVEVSGGSTDAMHLAVDIFNAGAQLVQDGSSMSLDKEEAGKVQQLAVALVQRQRQAFPIMRREFGPIAARMLWKNDIEASTKGTRYTTAAFVGGAFAAHKNIATAEEQIEPSLMRLRFKRSEYRWIPSEEVETTYYTIDSPPDDALAVVSMTGNVTLRVKPLTTPK